MTYGHLKTNRLLNSINSTLFQFNFFPEEGKEYFRQEGFFPEDELIKVLEACTSVAHQQKIPLARDFVLVAEEEGVFLKLQPPHL